MNALISNVLERRGKIIEPVVSTVKFCSYKLKPSLSTLPMVKSYTSEEIRAICESLNSEFINKYCLRIVGGKIINNYLFIRADSFRSQGNTKYVQLDLDTFETVNIWEANEFPETIEIGEYDT